MCLYMLQGGLKAVVWSDAFQMVVMVAGFLTVLVQGTHKSGGITAVWETAKTGQRLNVFESVSNNLTCNHEPRDITTYTDTIKCSNSLSKYCLNFYFSTTCYINMKFT